MLYMFERKITELLDYNEFPSSKNEKKMQCQWKVLSDISIWHKVKSFILREKKSAIVKDFSDSFLFHIDTIQKT